MRAFYIISALAFCLTADAAPHRPRVYPNSLAIFSMAEGPDGLLWLAAEDGLYRFDGFHYHKIAAYPFAAARFVAFTSDGSLWAADYEGLTRVRNHKFEIVLNEDVSALAAYPDQVFVRVADGLARIGMDGSIQRLKRRVRRDLSIDPSGILWYSDERYSGTSFDPAHPDQPQPVLQFPNITLYAQVVRDSLGRIWAADTDRALLVENGRTVLTLQRRNTIKAERPGPLLQGRNGQLWFLGEAPRGLIPDIQFRDRADHDRYSPISGLEDRQGHLWVGSFGQGLVEWIQDQQWDRWFPEDFGKEMPVETLRDPNGSLVVATQKHIYRREAAADRWSRITKQPFRYYALLPLEDGEFLASIRDFGLARISAQGTVVEHVPDLEKAEQYREIVRDGNGRVWVGTKNGLLRLEGRPGALRLKLENLPGILKYQLTVPAALQLDASKHLWVGYSQGLAWLDEQDRWHKIETDKPVTMVRDFALAGNDIWVAHRREGGFSRLHRSGARWNVTLLAPGTGYVPAGTEFLKRDSRGWIWRGTDEGVFVSDGKNIAPNDWLHIDMSRGLASNEMGQYGFFEDSDGTIWLTGDEGVTRLRPDPHWFDAPRGAPPQVTRIDADGRVYLYPETIPTALPTATKVLRVDAGALNASPFRVSAIRYRLLPRNNTWQLSRDGSLEFHNLAGGDYVLELSFTGEGVPPVATYKVRVGKGGSTSVRLWWIGLLASLAALILVVRFAPGLDRWRFRFEKMLFLLRRRLSHQKLHSPAGAHPVAPDYSGQTLMGRYHLNRVISRGGFSVVYEARDVSNGDTRLAVKVLNRNSRQDGWVRDRYAHEVAALRSLQHPGVVPILDSWISPAGEPCLAMPFLDGVTLRSAFDGIPFSLPRAAAIIRQLGSALGEVHRRGIVHRDLKPENLILTAAGSTREQVVVIDFGTAGLRTAENELAATTLMSGSFHYMAPERLIGRYSPASDVFSLGVMILEILTGKRLANLNATYSEPAFQAELENALTMRMDPAAAKPLADLLVPAYNPEPRSRPANVAEWAERVAAVIDSRGVRSDLRNQAL